MKPKIGILGLQGNFIEHRDALESLGVNASYIKDTKSISAVDGLIIPGGESTTMNILLARHNLRDVLIEARKREIPVLGTCAGAILMAKETLNEEPGYSLSFIDMVILRNAYGRQKDSFETEIELPDMKKKIRGVFIRAPRIVKTGRGVDILGVYAGEPVWVREKGFMATTFHPELTDDLTVHKLFVDMVKRGK